MNFVTFSNLFVFQLDFHMHNNIESWASSDSILKYGFRFSDINFFRCISTTLKKLGRSLIPSALLKHIKKSNNIVIYHIVTIDIITNLNFLYYKKQRKPTDILTFPYQDDYTNVLGEIFINPESANNKSVQKLENITIYCKRLIVHGLLHLLLGKHSSFFDTIEESILQELNN